MGKMMAPQNYCGVAYSDRYLSLIASLTARAKSPNWLLITTSAIAS
jgi:hypothetical protein